MIEEKIRANFEPYHPQISAATQMIDRINQDNSARILDVGMYPLDSMPAGIATQRRNRNM